MFGRRYKGAKLSILERNKIANFYDIALEEIDGLIEFFEKKAAKIAAGGKSAREPSNFPTARSTVAVLKTCRHSVVAMKDDVVTGRYDRDSLYQRTQIIAEYLGLCDWEAKIHGWEGIIGAGVASSVLSPDIE